MPYRADVEALKNRCESLESKLNELRARARELGDVQRDEERVVAELEAVHKRLGVHRGLPLLDNVRVASPCKADWEQMTGDDRVRFCGQCDKNVYNLSAMTRQDAEQLLLEKEGKVCVRFYRRSDGTVMTTDCPVGARRVRVRRVALAAVGGGLVAAAAAATFSAQCKCSMHTQGAVAYNVPTMGDVAMPTVAPTTTAPAPVQVELGKRSK